MCTCVHNSYSLRFYNSICQYPPISTAHLIMIIVFMYHLYTIHIMLDSTIQFSKPLVSTPHLIMIIVFMYHLYTIQILSGYKILFSNPSISTAQLIMIVYMNTCVHISDSVRLHITIFQPTVSTAKLFRINIIVHDPIMDMVSTQRMHLSFLKPPSRSLSLKPSQHAIPGGRSRSQPAHRRIPSSLIQLLRP